MSVPGRDVKLGKDHVKISRNFITKIWNAARFLQSKAVSFSKAPSTSGILNRWIITKLKRFQNEINQNMKDYRFDYATRNIQFFLRDTFCDFFVEAMKIVDDEETGATAGAVFAEFLRIANPFIPFVTDHLANVLGIADTLILADSSKIDKLEIFDEAEKEVDEFVEAIHEIRSEKQANGEQSERYISLREKIKSWPGELQKLSAMVR